MSESANPFLACRTCHAFVSGTTGREDVGNGSVNWPCGHRAGTFSHCLTWAPPGATDPGCRCVPGTHRVPSGPPSGVTPTADHDPDRDQPPRDVLIHAAIARAFAGEPVRSGPKMDVLINRAARNVCDVLGIAHSLPPGVTAR